MLELLSVSDLRRYPVPEWLILNHIHKGDVAVLYGPPGSGKSFLAIDWALSIASGLPWVRHQVQQGPVLFMAGEGAPSLYKRVHAWMTAHEIQDVPGAYFHLRPLPLREEEIITDMQAALSAYMDEEESSAPGLRPVLVVVDTLSQFFSGGDEVSPDMTQFVNNMRRLALENQVAVLIVHHSNAADTRERGHSSLRGNVEVMFKAEAIEAGGQLVGMTLVNDKQKDDPRVKPMRLSLNRLMGSLTISLANPSLSHDDRVRLTDKSLRILLETFEAFESKKTESFTHSDVMEKLDWTKPTFHRKLDKLKSLKLVTGAGRGKSALTLRGRNSLSHIENET